MTDCCSRAGLLNGLSLGVDEALLIIGKRVPAKAVRTSDVMKTGMKSLRIKKTKEAFKIDFLILSLTESIASMTNKSQWTHHDVVIEVEQELG